ncbi:alpha beta hydrolase fold protein [Phlyctema vagabunda]|uniref:Alpha beta hydrolase fold protein n=1 Tax=Phlyctema vagabunda TaxID=108571 RepID=A0ABR4P4J4_9HELO
MSGHHEALNPIHPSVLSSLDPTFIDLYNAHVAPIPNKPIDLDFLRARYSVLYSYGTAPAPEAAKQWETTVSGHGGAEIAVRMYEPAGPGPWPVHIDYHGGGWGLGDLDTESHICKHIVAKANVAVIDVAYRLVPEHVFPTGILDSFAAFKYIASAEGAAKFNIDPLRISIGGVSAGGGISLSIAHLARGAKIPLKLTAVGTPTIDDLSKYSNAQESPFPSMQTMEFAPTLNWARLKWFDVLKWSSLSKDPAEREKQMQEVGWFKDLMAAPGFRDVGKTVIYTAGCDPLRDEGEAYGRKLVENGNVVTLKRFEGVPHPFMHMDGALVQAREYIEMLSLEIKNALL